MGKIDWFAVLGVGFDPAVSCLER